MHGHGTKDPMNRKAKNFWKTTFRLIKYMSPWKWGLLLVIIFAISSVIFQTVTPKILGQATTEIFNGVLLGYKQMKAGQHLTHLPIDLDAIKHILLIVGSFYAVAAVLSFAQQLIMANISQRSFTVYVKILKKKCNVSRSHTMIPTLMGISCHGRSMIWIISGGRSNRV